MKSKPFIYIFLLLGLIFAGAAVYFATQPTNRWFGSKDGEFRNINQNHGYAALALGVVSASCFITAGLIVIKKSA
jgi:hypothetical protein